MTLQCHPTNRVDLLILTVALGIGNELKHALRIAGGEGGHQDASASSSPRKLATAAVRVLTPSLA